MRYFRENGKWVWTYDSRIIIIIIALLSHFHVQVPRQVSKTKQKLSDQQTLLHSHPVFKKTRYDVTRAVPRPSLTLTTDDEKSISVIFLV